MFVFLCFRRYRNKYAVFFVRKQETTRLAPGEVQVGQTLSLLLSEKAAFFTAVKSFK